MGKVLQGGFHVVNSDVKFRMIGVLPSLSRNVAWGTTVGTRCIIGLDMEWGRTGGTAVAPAATRVTRERGQASGARFARCVVGGRWGVRGVLKVTRAGVPRERREARVSIGADYPISDAEGDRDGTRGIGVDSVVEAGAAHQEPKTQGLE